MENNNYLNNVDRTQILQELQDIFIELKQKLENSRVKNVENEKIKIQWYKILVQVSRAMNDIIKDKEDAEIKKELKDLREAISSAPVVVKSHESDKLDNLAQLLS